MFSVIICTYNRDTYIYQTLVKIAQNIYPYDKYEIILVNNNSTDNTEKECCSFYQKYPQINFRYFIELNQGLSYARNRGIREAAYDILIFLDDDSFVKPDYLTNLERLFQKYPDVGAFGGKILPKYEKGAPPKWISKWSYSWVSAIDMGKRVKLFRGKRFPIGANMGFTRSCVTEIGFFNTELGRNKKNLMGGEEKDFFYRLKETGHKIYYFPDVEVEHVIPENRTTYEYLKRLGVGVGQSERMRCKAMGKNALRVRFFQEIVKWGGSFLLWFYYALQFKFSKGNVLVQFRWNVSKALLALN